MGPDCRKCKPTAVSPLCGSHACPSHAARHVRNCAVTANAAVPRPASKKGPECYSPTAEAGIHDAHFGMLDNPVVVMVDNFEQEVAESLPTLWWS